MKYTGVNEFSHQDQGRIGVLLVNLGTPDAPTAAALRRYLKEFLWDPRVVEMPRPLWWLILNGIILNIRPRRSAQAYRKVWTDQGSPLMLHTRAQCETLATRLAAREKDRIVVEFAMRYGNPSVASALTRLQDAGVRQLVVLPLYPQYSGATTGSTFDALAADFTRRRWLPDLRFVSHYHDFQPYIEAMARLIESHWQQHGRAQRLLFSFHGVPRRYLLAGDPYYCECMKTARLLAQRLGLAEQDYLTCFQSRFGREEWLTPYTDETLKALPAQGVRSVQLFCPGFAADCLETLEEIGVENRDYFLAAGGERYEYIAALNSTEAHIDALEQLVWSQISDWLQTGAADPIDTARRAREQGAAE